MFSTKLISCFLSAACVVLLSLYSLHIYMKHMKVVNISDGATYKSRFHDATFLRSPTIHHATPVHDMHTIGYDHECLTFVVSCSYNLVK